MTKPHSHKWHADSTNAGSDLDLPHETDRGQAVARLGWLLPALAGTLIGVCISAAYYPTLMAANHSRRQRSIDNSILVTQELDELFNIVEGRLGEGGAEVESYRNLMDVFRIYDREFSTRNTGNPDTQLAVAYAAKRRGHCALASGELNAARDHYGLASVQFEALLRETPEVLGLSAQWISVQLQLVVVELERGNQQAARDAYHAVLRVVNRLLTTPNVDSSRWLAPRLKSLALLGMELELYQDAKAVAERFVDVAQSLAEEYPANTNFAQQAVEATDLLQRLMLLSVGAT